MKRLLLLLLPLAGCANQLPEGCPAIAPGMPEGELVRCYHAYAIDTIVGPRGVITIYDSNLPVGSGLRHVFVRDGVVYGGTSR